MATETMTIGKLAKAVKIPSSTLRFYERKGLLVPTGRTDSRYRTYNAASVARVEFIRAAQGNGFSIKDIRELLNIADGKKGVCGDVKRLVERRLSDVRTKITGLWLMQAALENAVCICNATPEGEPCTFLISLKHDERK